MIPVFIVNNWINKLLYPLTTAYCKVVEINKLQIHLTN